MRRLTLAGGRIVDTFMGEARPRRGESLGERAERAFLTSQTKAEVEAGGRPIRVFDLYAGCGGFSLGLVEACRATGLRAVPVAAVDLDKDALAVYATNLQPKFPILNDVRELVDGLGGTRLTANERWLQGEVGRIDFLLAGPPCQGFSALNNQTRGNDPRNRLYEQVARAAEVLEPTHILIENVASVRSYSAGSVARTTDRLRTLGYSVDEGVVPVAAMGIPQLRRRHLVVASAEQEVMIDDVVGAFRSPPRDLRWAIGDLSRIRAARGFDRPSVPTPDNEKRMRYLREQHVWDLPDHLRPRCHRDVDHKYKSMYGRLRWNEPAQTITTGYGSMGQGRYVHPNGWRTLTPHEAARIQFFPDWFDFGERARNTVATLIGNAVPMKLSYVFGVWLLR